MPLSPADAALHAAISHRPTIGPRHGHDRARLDVAFTPTRTSLRLNTTAWDDPTAQQGWDAVRTALAACWPTIAWPFGLRLACDAQHNSWSQWRVANCYIFGHAVYPDRLGLNLKDLHWSWKEDPIGLDAAATILDQLAARIPPSNGHTRAFSEAHTLMQTPYVSSRRVVARSEAEALIKMAWLSRGTAGVDALINPEKTAKKDHATWLVSTELVEDDGFATPQSNTDALDAIRRHNAGQ